MFLTSFFGFVFFISIFAYLPGKIITRLTKLPDWLDLQLIVGLSLLPLILFFGRFILPTPWLLSFYLFSTIFLFKKLKLKLKPAKLKTPLIALIIIFIGVLAQSLPYLKTAFLGLDQLVIAIASDHDQAWHASLIYELTRQFPPQVPGFSNTILKNYHYFYDLIIAANVSIFKSRIDILLQLIYPIFISTLFGFSLWRVISLIAYKKIFRIFALLLVFLSNNLSFLLVPLGLFNFSSNSLLIDHPLFFLFNHQTVFSIALIFYLLILLSYQLKSPLFSRGIAIGLLIASLSYFKVYGFLVFIITLLLISIKNFKKLQSVLISAGLTTLAILSLTLESAQSFLTLKPFWLISAFTDKIIVPYLPQIYARSDKLWYSLLVVILVLGLNFHFQLLGFFARKKSTLTNLIFLITITSFTFLFFGFQTQSPYNIVQFAPYAVIGLCLLTVAFASGLSFKTGLSLLSLSLIFSLPVSLNTLKAFASTNPQLPPLRQEIVELMTYLKPLPKGLTLSLVDRDYHLIPDPNRSLNFIGNNLISSLAQKRAYFADQKQLEVLKIDYQSRLDEINQLKQNFCQDKSLLIQESINYLILADDLTHCTGDNQLDFNLLYQTQHFSLFKIN
ncbi:hypothetical protein ACFL18_00455 [Patescibacteria group bacterium]